MKVLPVFKEVKIILNGGYCIKNQVLVAPVWRRYCGLRIWFGSWLWFWHRFSCRLWIWVRFSCRMG